MVVNSHTSWLLYSLLLAHHTAPVLVLNQLPRLLLLFASVHVWPVFFVCVLFSLPVVPRRHSVFHYFYSLSIFSSYHGHHTLLCPLMTYSPVFGGLAFSAQRRPRYAHGGTFTSRPSIDELSCYWFKRDLALYLGWPPTIPPTSYISA